MIFVVAVLFLAILITVVVIKVKTGSENFTSSSITSAKNKNGLVYKKNVFVLNGNDYDVDDSSITLDSKEDSLKKGQILIGKEAPGFMRKITGVSHNNGKTVLMTENVGIQDVIQHGKLKKRFRMHEMTRLSKLSTRRRKQALRKGRRVKEDYSTQATGKTEWDLPYANTFDLGHGSSLALDGKVTAEPSVSIDLSIGWTGVESLKFTVETDITAEMTATASGAGTVYSQTFEKQLYPVEGSEAVSGLIIPVFEGVWVTITPEIDSKLAVKLSGSFNISATANIHTATPFTAGFSYTKGSPIEKFSTVGTWSASLSDPVISSKKNYLKLSMKPSLDIQLNAMFWGYIGPYIGVDVGLEYDYKVSASTCPDQPKFISFWSNPKLCTSTKMTKKLNLTAHLGGSFFDENLDYPVYTKTWKF